MPTAHGLTWTPSEPVAAARGVHATVEARSTSVNHASIARRSPEGGDFSVSATTLRFMNHAPARRVGVHRDRQAPRSSAGTDHMRPYGEPSALEPSASAARGDIGPFGTARTDSFGSHQSPSVQYRHRLVLRVP